MARSEILLVDDDPQLLDILKVFFRAKDFRVTTASNGEHALAILLTRDFDLVISDLNMGETSGIEVLRITKARRPRTAFILYSGSHDIDDILQAFRAGADDYLLKPCPFDKLMESVLTCLAVPGQAMAEDIAKMASADNDRKLLEMMAGLTHDIRSKTLSMVMALQLIKKGKFGKMDTGVADQVNRLYVHSNKLAGMAEEYLTTMFAAHEDKRFAPEHLDLVNDIITPVMDEYYLDIIEKGVVVDNHIPWDEADRFTVEGNRVWLKSVFRNLLGNAILHSNPGATVGINLEKTSNSYRLFVFNSGPPISEELQDELFAANGNGHHNGMGLGLSLSRQIAKRHGGDILYENVDNGAAFVVRLPQIQTC